MRAKGLLKNAADTPNKPPEFDRITAQ